MQINTFPITLVESFMISPKVKHFIFSCQIFPYFNYSPGQFITIHFEHEGKTLKRSYSIANIPKQDNKIEIAAGYFENGPGTELLYHLKPGDSIQVSGPYGRLTMKEGHFGRFILVATSTGVTPYRSMLQDLGNLMNQHPELQVVILQGVQRREEILYADEFRDFVQKYPQAAFRPYLSRQPKEELVENEFSGYVQHAFPSLNLNPEKDIIYLCGNPGMIDEAFNSLKDQGFAMQQIIREKYISR
ncbi:ferredoxin--NADP reductase [Legionella longbeachae]|uniref:ferredoxin--NADP(+) reductase n=1 Tax=Legionella longbeachae serogroup 1 (strain NSW150) TaxID=661367 RepID=D3HL27_LEGLN|nr:ferredoxin--NADP reductase [Legionella longbeachae]VEE03653.1 ferredoxin-NADP reductase [Legionella oakridgensis]HBD7397541.1 ferredoxin--NADP reductase [Legionella pneumophila]ARB93464.1 ferredoxin--NADP reductase [Legionella longbeachae]ARM33432.1 ferredoxin--NADP reductase [Legionella longbeachae]EEZ93721.1 putative phenol hydroxylase [Legionella longbeachae D-4968]